jgi:anaerobic magnesium-protoporphyrin IX monomethyl ester cyclase
MNSSPSPIPWAGIKFRRAAVIVPPFRDFYFTRHRFSSLGAHIVARLLTRTGLQVEFMNFPLMDISGTILEIPDELEYIKPFLIPEETGKLSFFTRFRRFGPTIERCVATIETVRPEICFLSVFAFCYADDAVALAEKIKTKLPIVPIIAGGAGVSAYPSYFLKSPAIDYALSGEAEACLPRFMPEISLSRPDFSRVPNLIWKENNTVLVSPLRVYAADKEIEIALIKTAESTQRVTFSTSLIRGCPKGCDFCSSTLLFGRQIRTPLPDRIGNHISALSKNIDRGGKQLIVNFEDDNLLCAEGFFRSTISMLRKHLPGVIFIAENGIDYTLLTPELCEWLVVNGMRKFNLSLASLDPDLLEKQGRRLILERYEKIISFLALKGVPRVTYFICGFKEDTLESTIRDLYYLHNKQTTIGISTFYAVPGLPGFTDPSLFDKKPSMLCLGSAAYPWNNSLSTATMITAFRLSRYINLKKSSSKSAKEEQLIAVTDDTQKLHTLIREKSGRERITPVPRQDKELVKMFFQKLWP